MGTSMTSALLPYGGAACFMGVGAICSSLVFNKLSHIVEYTLNKRFGDYTNLKRTLDQQNIIVSMGPKNDYYYTQNVVLAALVGCISSIAIQILALAGCPNVVTSPLLAGSIAAPILFGLMNIVLRSTGWWNYQQGRWVTITEEEAIEHGGDPTRVPVTTRVQQPDYKDGEIEPTIEYNAFFYPHFGSGPWH